MTPDRPDGEPWKHGANRTGRTRRTTLVALSRWRHGFESRWGCQHRSPWWAAEIAATPGVSAFPSPGDRAGPYGSWTGPYQLVPLRFVPDCAQIVPRWTPVPGGVPTARGSGPAAGSTVVVGSGRGVAGSRVGVDRDPGRQSVIRLAVVSAAWGRRGSSRSTVVRSRPGGAVVPGWRERIQRRSVG